MPKIQDKEILHWNETTYNRHCRESMLQQGLRAIHVREANEPGVSDLIVSEYENFGVEGNVKQRIIAWLELKIGWDIDSVRPTQREFMRQQWEEAQNAWFGALIKYENPIVQFYRGDLREGVVLAVPANPYRVDWHTTFIRLKQCSLMPVAG